MIDAYCFFKKWWRLWLSVLVSRYFFFAWSLIATESLVSAFSEEPLLNYLQGGELQEPILLIVGLSILVIYIIWCFTILMMLLCGLRNSFRPEIKIPLKLFLAENFKPIIIETTRSLGSILTWSLLFVIPGILRYIKLCLVPYVVIFDNQYLSGQIDALKKSASLSKDHWWQIFIINILLMVLPNIFLIQLFSDLANLIDKYILIVMESLGISIILLLYLTGLFLLFRKLLPHENFSLRESVTIADNTITGG